MLASKGYFGGNPENVYKASVSIVMDTWDYMNFKQDFEIAIKELNKD